MHLAKRDSNSAWVVYALKHLLHKFDVILFVLQKSCELGIRQK